MTTVIINPGTGPVANATLDHAWANMGRLIKDAGVPDTTFERDPDGEEDDGRYDFIVKCPTGETTVCMPGTPLKRVRFTGAPGQNIWHFPRLYVDGNSWVWKYAVSILRSTLTGEDE